LVLFLEGNDFKNHLKIYLKYWKKKIEIFSFLNFWPEGLFSSSLSRRSQPGLYSTRWSASQAAGPLGLIDRQPRFSGSRAANWTGPAEAAGRLAPAALPFSSLRVAATPGPLVSVVVVFFLLLVTE
jgi:hypothetical protein